MRTCRENFGSYGAISLSLASSGLKGLNTKAQGIAQRRPGNVHDRASCPEGALQSG